MRFRRLIGMTAALALLSACGGGGSGTSAPTPTPTPTPVPTPTPSPTAGCALRDRQDWAAAQMREWYLFPETLPASLDPAAYSTLGDYVDALTATARGQRRDRYFTYVTSIAEENAYYNAGSSAGFGFRLATDSAQRRIFVIEAFENAPALIAGIDRGAEILAIGTSASDMRTVADIAAASGLDGVSNALGPDDVGVTRRLRINDATGMHEVNVTKADFTLLPVSTRYGAKIIDDGGRRVGYINLRTFITPAETPLRNAFAMFSDQGITEVVIDLRYNGGGLLSTAAVMANLMGKNRFSSDVFSYITYRSEKSSENRTYSFIPQSESIAPTRIAFIGGGSTASASELLINGFVPYLDTAVGLIGSNTYGKPVGQIALDRPQCDDRLRAVAFSVQNSLRSSAYFDGLAGTVKASCRSDDDIGHALGDPQEASTRQALDFLAGRSCTPIASGPSVTGQSLKESVRKLVSPLRPSTIQREVPGSF